MTKKMGRPKIKINWALVDNMCAILCTEEEIAGVLNISVDTLARRCKDEYDCTFAEYYKKNSASGKMSLRRMQYNRAMGTKDDKGQFNNDGSVTMLIWLGKQWLNQADKQEVAIDGEVELTEVATALKKSYSTSSTVPK